MFKMPYKLPVSIIFVIFLIAILSPAARAALVSIDDPIHGVGAITRDSGTGLEWLDVPLSVNWSFVDITYEFGVGGKFEGFRHATGAELIELYTHAGIPDIDVSNGSSANIGPVTSLIGLVGDTDDQDGNPETFGFVYDTFSGSLRYSGDLDFLLYNGSPVYAATVFNGFARNENIPLDFAGHWLVRQVPIPSSLLLLATGLTVFGGIIRRKKSAGQ